MGTDEADRVIRYLEPRLTAIDDKLDERKKVDEEHAAKILALQLAAAADKVRWSLVAKVAGISAGGGVASGAALIKLLGG